MLFKLIRTLFKSRRINKITKDHSEYISDSMILWNAVSLTQAGRNLGLAEYKMFKSIFLELCQDTSEYLTNVEIYTDRLIGLIYELECRTGVPYKLFYGDALLEYKLYNEVRQVRLDKMLCQYVEKFNSIIESIIQNNNLANTSFDFRCCAVSYFTGINSYLSKIRRDKLPYGWLSYYVMKVRALQMASNLAKDIGNDSQKIGTFMNYNDTLSNLRDRVIIATNHTTSAFVQEYTQGFMHLCGIDNDTENLEALIRLAESFYRIDS